jgi:hypothetical protein
MYSAFSSKMTFPQTNATNNLHDETAPLSPRFRADGNAWFNFPSNELQTHQFNNLLSAPPSIDHSAPGPMRGNNMRCRPVTNYSMPYNAGLLRRKSCPGDLINTMYTHMANANREKLQDIPEDMVPNTSFLADNMNCYMNSMQVTINGLRQYILKKIA